MSICFIYHFHYNWIQLTELCNWYIYCFVYRPILRKVMIWYLNFVLAKNNFYSTGTIVILSSCDSSFRLFDLIDGLFIIVFGSMKFDIWLTLYSEIRNETWPYQLTWNLKSCWPIIIRTWTHLTWVYLEIRANLAYFRIRKSLSAEKIDFRPRILCSFPDFFWSSFWSPSRECSISIQYISKL